VSAIVPAARHLAVAARAVGARLVHVSSDLVFDGEHAPYPDEAPPSPIMDYGRAKAQAEAVVAAIDPGAAIVRPSLIWALEPLDRQTAWLVDGLLAGGPITLFVDEIRCPVHLPDLAAALFEIAVRHELAGLRLLAALGLQPGHNVVAGTVLASGLVRPRDLTLLTRRAERELSVRLRGVHEVLTERAVAEGAPRLRRPRYCEG
jgi:dTDP-4-dehydrorhamnose reductase